MIRSIIAVSAMAFALAVNAPARAEFSEEWEAYAAETHASCEAFEAGLPSAAGVRPTLRDAGDVYVWPRGAPGRPHICLYFGFDVGEDGAPINIQLLFKGPSNLNYKFVRAGIRLIKSRRYEPSGGAESYASVVTRITVLSEPDWRFRYWVADLP